MENKTLTAVEQLIEAIQMHGVMIDNLDAHYYLELEKEQILDAVTSGFGISCFETGTSAEQYYTTKYGEQ